MHAMIPPEVYPGAARSSSVPVAAVVVSVRLCVSLVCHTLSSLHCSVFMMLAVVCAKSMQCSMADAEGIFYATQSRDRSGDNSDDNDDNGECLGSR